MISDDERARREQLAEEHILTDERLRGDLTDAQFDAILAWALPAADAAAAATFEIDDAAAADDDLYGRLDVLKDRIRSAAEDAVRIAAGQDAGEAATDEADTALEPAAEMPAAPEPAALPAPASPAELTPPEPADEPAPGAMNSLLKKLNDLIGGAL